MWAKKKKASQQWLFVLFGLSCFGRCWNFARVCSWDLNKINENPIVNSSTLNKIPAKSLENERVYSIILYYIMLCYVMLCYVMLWYVMLCYVMLCYIIYLPWKSGCFRWFISLNGSLFLGGSQFVHYGAFNWRVAKFIGAPKDAMPSSSTGGWPLGYDFSPINHLLG